jgi:hypothetical protein
VKIALTDHFWCDLLAQLAHVMNEGLKLTDDAGDRIADLVLKSRKDGKWRPLEEKVVRLAAAASASTSNG